MKIENKLFYFNFFYLFFFLFCLLSYVYAEDYTSLNLPDPFEAHYVKKVKPKPIVVAPPPKVEEVINPPAITIDALITGGRVPLVIIGGKILKIGEMVGGTGAVLTKITKDGAEVLYKTKTFSYSGPAKRMGGGITKAEELKTYSKED